MLQQLPNALNSTGLTGEDDVGKLRTDAPHPIEKQLIEGRDKVTLPDTAGTKAAMPPTANRGGRDVTID
ncbi:hypothetical protein [Asaia bogorensis]|uniref:hypothetical protein n=1 Tax=Asaia bogorensis TaxID=91915 RepID=UPI0013CF29A8|nr:hypothetical protein [Asaia bogorensis]